MVTLGELHNPWGWAAANDTSARRKSRMDCRHWVSSVCGGAAGMATSAQLLRASLSTGTTSTYFPMWSALIASPIGTVQTCARLSRLTHLLAALARYLWLQAIGNTHGRWLMGIDGNQALRRSARGILIDVLTARDAFRATSVARQAAVQRYQLGGFALYSARPDRQERRAST